jgi:glycosyltransferase involved in cell wall biosynthesis
MDSAYEKSCVAKVKNLISISPYVEDELERIGGFNGTVFRIDNPVADDYFSVGPCAQASTILCTGRVIPRKDLLTLLRALDQVHQEMPQVHLRIAGETDSAPAYVEACRQFIRRQELETSVAFLGSLSVRETVAEYANCAIFALTSRQETAPVAVAEAMAARRPVVATAVCGIPHMVQDSLSGLLVEPGDVHGLANALLRLLRDRKLCAQMGAQGRAVAEERFRLDVVARKTRDVYARLCTTSS